MLDRLFPSLGAFARGFALATPGGDARETDGVLATMVPQMPGHSVVNCVVYKDTPALEAQLDALATTYDDAAIEAWTVWVHESDERAIRALDAAGNVFDGEPMAMGRELDGIEAPAPGELDLVPDPDPAAVADILVPVYEWDGVQRALVGWHDGYHPYVARVDGKPVATLAIHDHDGDAHVTLVGTLEAARGRGLATLLMRQALADARERGCTTTTLVATKMGHPIYARLGYRDYGRVQMWERRRSSPADAA